MLLFDQPHPKLIGEISVPVLAEEYCYPEDVVHQALMLMIEEGTIEYRPEGLIEFMPTTRRQLEREGVR